MVLPRFACPLVILFLSVALWSVHATESFPFGSELMLDSAPMHGSKRVPMLEIDDNGMASIDLWCASTRGQATVGDGSITIVPAQIAPGETQAVPCEAARQASDAGLLAALSQVTNWRRNGDLIELTGPTTLRFRLMTN